MTLSLFTDKVLSVLLVILAIMVLVCLLRAVIGPRVPDRIVSVNMMGTMVMVIIAILAIKNKEGYLADICVLYAMISFLAVVVLCKVYLGVYYEKKHAEEKKKEEQPDGNN
ncbi:MAG: sodium:proton antiporter [Lachnospiraceae bacterium]|nr:sodium:proton antiporter [Lachnospiraceae bacterium]